VISSSYYVRFKFYFQVNQTSTLACGLSDRLCGLVIGVPRYGFGGPGFDCECYHNFWETVVLERGPLSLVRATVELLGRNSSGSGLEIRD
jgi:hypothetical protein